jgi:hypothetical protein
VGRTCPRGSGNEVVRRRGGTWPLDPTGKRLHDGPLPNSEPKLRALFDKLAAHGPLLVVVDQPATIGALPVAVARAAGHQVAYLPGLAMRRIADLYPGRAMTDARDAFIIADAARSLPHTLRPVDVGAEALAELDVLAGFDDDLAGEATRIGNRIRGLLTGIHPALGRVRWAHRTASALLPAPEAPVITPMGRGSSRGRGSGSSSSSWDSASVRPVKLARSSSSCRGTGACAVCRDVTTGLSSPLRMRACSSCSGRPGSTPRSAFR